MKKNIKIFILFVAITALLFSACKSKPAAVPVKKPEPTVQDETKKNALREKERLLAELNAIQGENGLLAKARQRAVDFEADKAYPKEFAVPEELSEAGKKAVEAQKLKEAIAKFNEAITRYDTLSNLMIVAQMQAEIKENDFAKYAEEEFGEAEKVAQNTLTHYGLDHNMAKETSEDAINLYKKVLNKGYFELTKTAYNSAKNAKADCDSIKVARSRTEDYNFAVRLFNVGKSEAENSEYKKAFVAYTKSAEKFRELYGEVSLKRADAKTAMEAAAKRQAESKSLALEADKEKPLTEADAEFLGEDLELEDKTSPMSGVPVEKIADEEAPAEEIKDEAANDESEIVEETPAEDSEEESFEEVKHAPSDENEGGE